MKARFTVANKLILGFGVLIFASLINSLYTYSTLNDNQSINQNIVSIYDPSVSKLQELYGLINNSQMLVKNWVYIEKQSDTPDKQKLSDLHIIEFPAIKTELEEISQNWDSTYQIRLNNILSAINDTLFKDHTFIMNTLNSFSSYDDLMVLFEVTPMVEEGGPVIDKTQNILSRIMILEKIMEEKSVNAKVEMTKSFSWFQKFIIYAMIILSAFVIIVGFFTTRSIVVPIYALREFLITMTKGILPKEKLITNNDEIGDMGDALNGYVENIQKTSDFAVEIGTGKYDSDYQSLGEDDKLGNTLINMRKNLQKTEEDNVERTKKDEIRNWTTKGLADFGDILRQNSENMDKLAKNIMVNIIDYLKVNQGAIYIVDENEDGDTFLEMKSAIAYEREKYLKKNFAIKEGLVGRCAFEKLPIYLKEIPEDYIRIKSGLGTAEPTFLLLAPIVINDIVMGVIEIASLNEVPEYQIKFLTTLGENIASTILNVRTNEKTQHLLNESKVRGDELSAQEEELRQNMEELQATQEEAARREKEMNNNMDAINNTIGSIEIDKDGIIVGINDYLLTKLNQASSSYIGKNFQEVFASNNETEFLQAWSGVSLGENENITTNYITQDSEFWFNHSFTAIRNENGDFAKVIDFIIDATKEKTLEKEIESLKLSAN